MVSGIKKLRKILYVLLLIVIGYNFIEMSNFLIEGFPSVAYNYVDYVVVTAFSFISAISTILVSKIFGFKTKPGLVWVLFSIGIFCWFLGELMYSILDYLSVTTYPSIADISYMLAYIFIILGLIIQLKFTKSALKSKEFLIILLILGSIIVLGLYFVIIPKVQQYQLGAVTLLDLFISGIYYPIYDFILIILAFALVFKFKGGEFSRSWYLIAIGFITMAFADLFFAALYGIDLGEFLYNPLYYIAYVFMGLGALHLKISLVSN